MGLSDGGIRLTLRLPEDLRDQLLLSSRENVRSMNSEIITILEQSLTTNKKIIQIKEKALQENSLQENKGNYSIPERVSKQFEQLKPEHQLLIVQMIGALG